MKLNIDREVALLQRMTVGQLREKFEETWGEPTNTRNKQWLVKRIAWKMQANIEGDISQRARRRAAELARGTDSRSNRSQSYRTYCDGRRAARRRISRLSCGRCFRRQVRLGSDIAPASHRSQATGPASHRGQGPNQRGSHHHRHPQRDALGVIKGSSHGRPRHCHTPIAR